MKPTVHVEDEHRPSSWLPSHLSAGLSLRLNQKIAAHSACGVGNLLLAPIQHPLAEQVGAMAEREKNSVNRLGENPFATAKLVRCKPAKNREKS